METKTTEIALTSTLNGVLPVNEIKNASDARLLINTALRITGRVNLAICKAFQIVKDNKLYQNEYKTFDKFAKLFNMNKSNAYNYAKVGEFVTPDGTQSILPHLAKDFSFTQLVIISAKIDVKTAILLADNGDITPDMTVEKLKKFLNIYTKGENLNKDGRIDEKASEKDDEKADEKASEKADEKASEKADEKATKKTDYEMLDDIQRKFVDNLTLLAIQFAKNRDEKSLNLKEFLKLIKA